jgi:hypothetical protein
VCGSIDQGDSEAMFVLGHALAEGTTMPAHLPTAVSLLYCAIHGGNDQAPIVMADVMAKYGTEVAK